MSLEGSHRADPEPEASNRSLECPTRNRTSAEGLQPKSGNEAESYAIMSNIAVIHANLAGMSRVNSN